MRLLKFALIGLLLNLAGCAGEAKYSEIANSMNAIPPGQARIYFYRSGSFVDAQLQPSILLDNAVVGASKPGLFFYVNVDPGAHQASTTSDTTNPLALSVEAGESAYVRTAAGFGKSVGRIVPELVGTERARGEMQDLGFAGGSSTVGRLAPPVAPKTAPATATPALAPVATEASPAVIPAMTEPQAAEVMYEPVKTLPADPAAPNSAPVSVPPAAPAPATAPAPADVPVVEPKIAPAAEPVPVSVQPTIRTEPQAPTTVIPKSVAPSGPVTIGASSTTVEKLGREYGCEPESGASLISASGPVETYREQCRNGQVFQARCEMRQCSPLQ